MPYDSKKVKEHGLITGSLFLTGYFLNLAWESLHWVWFYIPDLPVTTFTYITHIASLGDGLWIAILYWLTALQAWDATWIEHPTKTNLAMFTTLGLIAATGIEAWAHLTDAWSYGTAMPELLGVGVSPLIQLSITGLASVYVTKTMLYDPLLTQSNTSQ